MGGAIGSVPFDLEAVSCGLHGILVGFRGILVGFKGSFREPSLSFSAILGHFPWVFRAPSGWGFPIL